MILNLSLIYKYIYSPGTTGLDTALVVLFGAKINEIYFNFKNRNMIMSNVNI